MHRVLIFIGFVTIFLFSSCLMNKIQYVKDMSPDSVYNIKHSQALRIQPNDRLAITVHSKDIELSAPFNTKLGGYKLANDRQVITDVNSNDKFEEGYLVDGDGYITFPILGKIHVEGKSLDETSAYIQNLIRDNGYLLDPEVKVNLLNFKVIVMGAVKNNTFTVTDNKITLIEAIVESGGLTIDSDAKNVKVIREENGKRKLILVNMEEYAMFNSEAFHLKQNDIVYVAHKYKQVTPETRSVWQIITMAIGVVSISLTSYALLIRK